MSKIHLVLLVQDNKQQTNAIFITRHPNKQPSLLHTKISENDAFSASISGSRIIIDKLNSLDLRLLSLNTPFHQSSVDMDSYRMAQEYSWANIDADEQHVMRLVRNPQTYMWSSYFNSAPLWNDDNEMNFYYFMEITHDDLNLISQNVHSILCVPINEINNKMEQLNQKYIQQYKDIQSAYLNKEHLNKEGKTILFLNFKGRSFDKYKPPRPYLDTPSIFNGIYRRKFDNWLIFNVAKGEHPSNEILAKTSCILMPGSGSSSYDRLDWIIQTEELLRNAYNNFPKIKFLAICFGLQIIVQALGGKVEPIMHAFQNGNTMLHYNPNVCKSLTLFNKVGYKQQGYINEAHGDEVTKLPEQLIKVASSKYCEVEVVVAKNERILGFQGHPEYSSGYYQIFALEFYTGDSKTKFKDIYAMLSQRYGQKSDQINLQLCKQFIRSD